MTGKKFSTAPVPFRAACLYQASPRQFIDDRQDTEAPAIGEGIRQEVELQRRSAEMLKKKQAGLAVSREQATPRTHNVVNLMDALHRSIAQAQAASARPPKGRKRIDGQAEMLLPIAGKAKTAPAAKSTVRPSARQMKTG